MAKVNKQRQKARKYHRFITIVAIGLSVLIGMQIYSQSLFGAERAPASSHLQDPTATPIPATPTNTPQPSGPPTPESLPLPTPSPTKPNWWIRSDDGGRLDFGLITAILPAGFTNQGGASVFGDPISSAEGIVIPNGLIVGTLFTFGIWPTTDQTDYQQPIEFRITLDAAQVAGFEDQLTVQMYNPSANRWVPVPAQFRPGSYQMVAQIHSFTPVAKNFPAWGGRSFIGVFKQSAPTKPLPADTPRPASGPVANRNANLRAGPGTNYPVTGGVRAGELIEPVAKLANGSWYLLADGAWIAAFLVDRVPELPIVESTPQPSRSSTATPIITHSRTPTPQSTPTKTPTSTATAESPTVHRIGLLTVSNNTVIDLDEGNASGYDAADLFVQIDTNEQILLIPVNGAQLAMNVDALAEFNICAQATVSTNVLKLEASDLEADLCVLTKQNRFVHLRILPSEESDTQEVGMIFTIWKEVATVTP